MFYLWGIEEHLFLLVYHVHSIQNLWVLVEILRYERPCAFNSTVVKYRMLHYFSSKIGGSHHFWGVLYDNRMLRTRAVQGSNKGRDGSRRWIGMGFMISLSILRCGSRIIKSLRDIRPLGILTLWGKLAYKYGLDWPDELEVPDRMGQEQGRWIESGRQRIRSANIGS